MSHSAGSGQTGRRGVFIFVGLQLFFVFCYVVSMCNYKTSKNISSSKGQCRKRFGKPWGTAMRHAAGAQARRSGSTSGEIREHEGGGPGAQAERSRSTHGEIREHKGGGPGAQVEMSRSTSGEVREHNQGFPAAQVDTNANTSCVRSRPRLHNLVVDWHFT